MTLVRCASISLRRNNKALGRQIVTKIIRLRKNQNNKIQCVCVGGDELMCSGGGGGAAACVPSQRLDE